MHRSPGLVAALLLTGSLTACSSGGEGSPDATSSSPIVGSSSSATTTSAAPSSSSATKRVLSAAELTRATLALADLPPGYVEETPSGSNRTFCGYKPPVQEKQKSEAWFIKGVGSSQMALTSTLRQFATSSEAKKSFDALANTLKTCKQETYQGETFTYRLMSAPKLGNASLGVQISSGGTTAEQNFILNGPVLISVGGVALTSSNPDIQPMIKAQVQKLDTAQTQP
ncbi:hypothetical protein IEE94_03630 [Yimella sp. cx-573]|nr:hypothetical protein [Yimella sp. cx-573]